LPDLPYLVRFGVASVALNVQLLTEAFLSEDVMTSAYPFDKPQAQQERPQVVEANVCIRPAA